MYRNQSVKVEVVVMTREEKDGDIVDGNSLLPRTSQW